MSCDIVSFPRKPDPATPEREAEARGATLQEAVISAITKLEIAGWRCERGRRFARKEVREIIDDAMKELREGLANDCKAARRGLGPDLLAAINPAYRDRVPVLQDVFSVLYHALSPSSPEDDE